MQFNFTQNKFSSVSSLSNNYKAISLSNYSPAEQMPSFLSLLERPKIYTGYMNGYRQPVARMKIKISSFNLLQTELLQQALREYFGSTQFNIIQTELELVRGLGQGICAIQKAAKLPIFEPVQIDVISREENIFNLWIPFFLEDCFHQATAFMLQFLLRYLVSPQSESNLMDEMNQLIDSLKSYAPNENNQHFLEAAFNVKIPYLQLPQGIFQYGYGRNSHWLDSTFTDSTSLLGARLARDKLSTLVMLEKAGLPVPEQKMVKSEAEAMEAARKIGFPVVIKPHNQDAGNGVFAKLMSENHVKNAYAGAREYSDLVLLEKHIVGKDYRLIVLNGELVWAIERLPAGVTGDGISTISELIYKINQERQINTPLKQIEISEDTHDFLSDQGYELSSVLELGKFLPVSRIANVSHGGTPVAVFEQVHPDNKLLAETAANLLRLDLAGIDFISPDIKQSYLTTGGCIIEVNSQPQLGVVTAAHMFKQILTTLLPNQGRIPIFVICSNSSDDLFIFKLHSLLAQNYQNIGIARDNCAYINTQKINQTSSLYSAAESLLLNTKLDALIFCINSLDDVEMQGLPFDNYDGLFFLDTPLAENDAGKDLVNTVFKACGGIKLINENLLNYFAQFDIAHESCVILPKSKMLEEMTRGDHLLLQA